MAKKSIAAVACRQGRFLVARRKAGGSIGLMWEFPGGKVENGETDEDAVIREFSEEFGAAVTPLRCLGQYLFDFDGGRRELSAWLVDLPEPQVLELREHSELRWMTIEELRCADLAWSDRGLIDFLQPLLP